MPKKQPVPRVDPFLVLIAMLPSGFAADVTDFNFENSCYLILCLDVLLSLFDEVLAVFLQQQNKRIVALFPEYHNGCEHTGGGFCRPVLRLVMTYLHFPNSFCQKLRFGDSPGFKHLQASILSSQAAPTRILSSFSV